ncbi:MAG: glutamate synthase subunit beta [SAR324 cluster bacterium]|nr:glutamate synthase subunit beta [SAR324 cluster bacterium]
MGKPTGFMEFIRENPPKESIKKRIKHFKEFEQLPSDRRLTTQAARCMDCGVPFCNWGCNVKNLIPEFNEYVYQGQWRAAYGALQSTNNFPEVTGRICPAPCEGSCVAGLVEESVTIRMLEKAIIEKAFAEGWVKPNDVAPATGVKIAVIGSGPSGLASAQQLNLAGHDVTVYEKNEVIGGLMSLGIPDFKLELEIVERRVRLLEQEGIKFKVNSHVGKNLAVKKILKDFDYVCLTGGSEKPRDLPIPGRELKGIHFAMDFLTQQNRLNACRDIQGPEITAKDKRVVVIGGGDTGSDCVGTSIRQGAISVTQIEILPAPPRKRNENNPWPEWAKIMRTSSSQEEGCKRDYAVVSQEFVGKKKVEAIKCARVKWSAPAADGRSNMTVIADSEFELKADLVLLAMGFLHPVHEGMLKDFGIDLDQRGNVATDNFRTSVKNIFAAGDMAHGQSLIVRAINSGREMAKAVDMAIKGYTHLS